VGCIEEIAYKKGFINKQQLIDIAQPLIKSGYGSYLLEMTKGK
ncbi:MAG: glucose-1-phosphate thymidylyltransferase, partial [Crocinitomicaceae bacterium]|nr:glucose-1-phosphate thymidylyltransferase [Crocinitomicaceae bacterium]